MTEKNYVISATMPFPGKKMSHNGKNVEVFKLFRTNTPNLSAKGPLAS